MVDEGDAGLAALHHAEEVREERRRHLIAQLSDDFAVLGRGGCMPQKQFLSVEQSLD